MKANILFCLCFFSFFQSLSAQTLTLDPTFGINGKVVNSFSEIDDTAQSVVELDDGKLLVCGFKRFSLMGNIYLTKYSADGSTDISFGTNGSILTPLTTESGSAHIMKIQADGKILVTGSKSNSHIIDFFDYYTTRYNADGSVDTAFGNNGVIVTDILATGDFVKAIGVQSDGKIIIAGYTYSNTTTSKKAHACLVRYLNDGAIDTTFGTNGHVLLPSLATDSNDYVSDMKILSDDSILLGASTTALETIDDIENIALVKLHSDGAVDTAFGNNGTLITDFGESERLYAIDEYEGKIIIAGYTAYHEWSPQYFHKMILAKYSSDGTLDSTFGVSGKVMMNKDAASVFDGLFGMKVQSDGKILCSGWTGYTGAMDTLLIQFNTDGSIDTGFNGTGYISTDFDAEDNRNYSFARQADGNIVCAGYTNHEGYNDSVLIRYHVDALDNTQFNIENHFSVFPNPFRDKITLNLNLDVSENLSVDLFDANGRKIKNILQQTFQSGSSATEILMPESLSKGVYFIRVYNGSTNTTLKIIK